MTKRNMPLRPPREHLSHDLIGQYLFGKLPERTRNRVERHLLECDFCSDAVDGYTGQSNPVKAGHQLEDLRSRLNKRVNRFRLVLPFGMQPYAVAASVILLITCTLAVWMVVNYSPNAPATSPVAQQTAPAVTPPVTAPTAEPPPAGQEEEVKREEERVSATPGIADSISDNIAKQAEMPSPTAENEQPTAFDAPQAGKESIAEESHLAEKSVAAVRDKADMHTGTAAPQRATARGITRVVRGKVTDATSGAPLPGVSIAIKGSEGRILSDAHGNFAVEVPAGSPTLVFNLVGMTTAEEDVRTADFLRVQLAPDDASLRDVVVVGYGESAKSHSQAVTPLGGMDEFNRYVKENLRRPDSVRREAVVKVECVVQADGSLSNFVIRKSAGEVYDREVIRVLKEGPRWQPAKQQGKAVPKKVTLRVPFKP